MRFRAGVRSVIDKIEGSTAETRNRPLFSSFLVPLIFVCVCASVTL